MSGSPWIHWTLCGLTCQLFQNSLKSVIRSLTRYILLARVNEFTWNSIHSSHPSRIKSLCSWLWFDIKFGPCQSVWWKEPGTTTFLASFDRQDGTSVYFKSAYTGWWVSLNLLYLVIDFIKIEDLFKTYVTHTYTYTWKKRNASRNN